MRPPRRTRPSLAAVLVAGLLAAGCGVAVPEGSGSPSPGSGAVGSPAPERSVSTLRVGLGRDPRSLDPRFVSDDEGEFVARALFEGLTGITSDGQVVPAGAEQWRVEDDGLTYRFLLRDAFFHDGVRVTAQQYADALFAVFDPQQAPFFRESLLAALRGAEASVVPDPDGTADDAVVDFPRTSWGTPDDVAAAGGIEVVDERELVLRLHRPDPLLLHRLSDIALVPLPPLATIDPETFGREPIGNGAFRMAGAREPGAFIRLLANRDHHAPPRVDEMLVQIYPDDADRSQRWADLLAGRLQIAAVPVDRRDEARERFGRPASARAGSGVHDLPLMTLYAYGFVLDVAPFDSILLRQAISAAIDRDSIALELAAAGVVPADALLPPSVGDVPQECAHCRYDPELAIDRIGQWRDGLPPETREPRIVLSYPRGGGHVTVAERIADDLERILGLDVRLQSREFGALIRSVATGDAGFFRYGLRAPVLGDASAFALLETALRSGSDDNWVRWASPATEDALTTWTPESSPDELRQVEAAVLEAAAIVPLLWTRQDLVVLPEVQGFRSDPSGRWWPEEVWLQ